MERRLIGNVSAEGKEVADLGKKLWAAGLPVIDDLHHWSYGWELPENKKPTDENLQNFKTAKYLELLKNAKPGITMVLMHCTSPTEVFPHISDSGDIRKADLLAMKDPRIKQFIADQGIILTTWKELKSRRDLIYNDR